jgi:hypothetical protein
MIRASRNVLRQSKVKGKKELHIIRLQRASGDMETEDEVFTEEVEVFE